MGLLAPRIKTSAVPRRLLYTGRAKGGLTSGRAAGKGAQPCAPTDTGLKPEGRIEWQGYLRSGGRVQRGRSPLRWGSGVPTKTLSAPLPFRWESPERAHPSPVGSGVPTKTLSAPLPFRWESPERAQPSLVGGWGQPPQPLSRSASRQGSGRSSAGREVRRPLVKEG